MIFSGLRLFYWPFINA